MEKRAMSPTKMSKMKPKSPSLSDDNDTSKEYIVEKIIDSRVNADGVKEYFLKWQDFDDNENSWEPEDKLNCPRLIAAFEAEKVQKGKLRSMQRKASSTPLPMVKGAKPKNEEKKVHGFERGLQAKNIIGATERDGQLLFLMEWEGTDDADLVLARHANEKCPQVVIRFYEQCLTWETNDANKIE